MSKESLKIQQGQATRAKLIAAARKLFASGYDAVATPEIVKAAKVTRGALYHHFPDKQALFAAVADDVARDLVKRIDAVAEEAASPVDAVIEGCKAFLACAADRETRQIFLIDAPAVLGWRTWRAIDARHGLGSLKEGLEACAAAGEIHPSQVAPLAHWISGALNEAVFVLAHEQENGPAASALPASVERYVRAMIAAAR